jgi:hypothetical protein
MTTYLVRAHLEQDNRRTIKIFSVKAGNETKACWKIERGIQKVSNGMIQVVAEIIHS